MNDIDQIVQKVIEALKAESKDISALPSVTSFAETDFVELDGGRKASVHDIAQYIYTNFVAGGVTESIIKEQNIRKSEDAALSKQIVENATLADGKIKAVDDYGKKNFSTKAELGQKVSKKEGYDLFSSQERFKLANIEEGANNYVHPSVHPASMIVEDDNHKFATAKNLQQIESNRRSINSILTSMVVKEEGKSLMSDAEHAKLARVEGIITIVEFVESVTIAPGSTSEAGQLVYDSKVNKLLWKVMYDGNPHPTYFAQASLCPVALGKPALGIVYKCKKDTYISTDKGLIMQHNNFDVDVATVIEDADEIILKKGDTEMRIGAADLRKYTTYDTIVEELITE